MFALDERLVARHGFSRVSLEPSYYDDTRGVVQRYDGIYFRPDRPARGRSDRLGVRVEAVLTSVGPTPAPIPGKEPHARARHLEGCHRSWSALGRRVVSVSESPPPPETGIEWVKTESRPTLAQMLTAMSGQHLVLTNADILVTSLFVDILPQLDPEGVYYGHRYDVAAASSETGVLHRPTPIRLASTFFCCRRHSFRRSRVRTCCRRNSGSVSRGGIIYCLCWRWLTDSR